MPNKTGPGTDPARFQIGEYYLASPYPARGGIWYACRHDALSRTVRRRSLGTADFEQAKIALATLVASAPQAASRQGPPQAGEVLTLAVLKAYLDERGSSIASEDVANKSVELFTMHLQNIGEIEATVSFWTPSRQIECAKWLHEEFGHSAGGIARRFNVMRAAFIDACEVKMRVDPIGTPVETALIASAPKIVMRQERIAKELEIPVRPARRKTLSLDQMATVLDSLKSEHLFRFAIIELCTWARPQAVIDFDPVHQVDWNATTIDLAPLGWRATNKRRPVQPMTQCLADWLLRWSQGNAPLLIYKRRRVGTTKQAWRRIGRKLGIEGFSQYSFRHFMADQTKALFRGIAREQRSLWLGHVVRDGSRTTDNYESNDPMMLADVALATDCIISLLAERCSRPLFAVEVRLNAMDLAAIGARALPKNAAKPRKNGGRDRDRTCDPLHVKVIQLSDYHAKPTKKRA